ncbi:Protein SPEAR1 [Linum grandiflorum]
MEGSAVKDNLTDRSWVFLMKLLLIYGFCLGFWMQEDIRAQTGYSSIPSSSFSYSSSPMPSYAYNPNIMMGGTDYERSSMRYGGDHTQPSAAAPSWNAGHSFYESRQANAAKQLFNLHETTSRSKKHRSSDSNGSSSHNSESSDSQELDLELRLSL